MRFGKKTKEESVAEKLAQILKSTLKSIIVKSFSQTSLKYAICEIENNSYLSDAKVDYNGTQVQKNLLMLNIILTGLSTAIIYITPLVSTDKIKLLLDLENYTGEERIETFVKISEANDFDFDIVYDSEKNELKNKIYEIGENIFKIKICGAYAKKMDIVLSFKNNIRLPFTFFYSESRKFLSYLKYFVSDLRKKDFADSEELYSRLKSFPLKEFCSATQFGNNGVKQST